MRIALFLPHVGVFGGVRRFLELGNAWTRLGHEVTLYHPDGTAPAWLPFDGRVSAALEAARAAALGPRVVRRPAHAGRVSRRIAPRRTSTTA